MKIDPLRMFLVIDHVSFPCCYVTPHVIIFNCTKNQSIFTFCSLEIGEATEALRVVNQVTDVWEVPTQLSLAAVFVQRFAGWRRLQAAEPSHPVPAAAFSPAAAAHTRTFSGEVVLLPAGDHASS